MRLPIAATSACRAARNTTTRQNGKCRCVLIQAGQQEPRIWVSLPRPPASVPIRSRSITCFVPCQFQACPSTRSGSGSEGCNGVIHLKSRFDLQRALGGVLRFHILRLTPEELPCQPQGPDDDSPAVRISQTRRRRVAIGRDPSSKVEEGRWRHESQLLLHFGVRVQSAMMNARTVT